MAARTGMVGSDAAVPPRTESGASAADAQQAAVEAQARRFVNVTFLSVLMRAMRQTVHRTGVMDGGRGEEVFRQQLDGVLIDRMSERMTTPLADAIVRQAVLARPPQGSEGEGHGSQR